jgi:hypothetical protein
MSPSEYQALIEFLGRRFDAIDQQFVVIDQRFVGIDQQFEVIDRRFVSIDQQFVVMFRRFDAVDRRFETMQGQLDGNHREALGHFDEVYRRLERLDQEYVAVTQALRRLER